MSTRHNVFAIFALALFGFAGLGLGLAGEGVAQTNPPPGPPLRMQLGDAVATGFSGVAGASAQGAQIDRQVIDLNGASARVLRVPSPKSRWDASVVPTPVEWSATAAQIGQVFGVAIGDRPDPNASPNLYFGATSAYGLHIVRRMPDGSFERLRAGAPGAMWAPGQFGLALQGGPGAIYVADGRTGAVNLLTNVALDGVPNPGPGLGALAFDGKHGQIFASDLYTGMIHRIGLDGADRGRFDHGATARAPAVPFDPRVRMNIATPAFNADDPASWGLAPAARRVWAVTVEGGRLYYSVEEGLQIWSVGLRETGDFADDARFEATIPAQPGPYPITDIAFRPTARWCWRNAARSARAFTTIPPSRAGASRASCVWCASARTSRPRRGFGDRRSRGTNIRSASRRRCATPTAAWRSAMAMTATTV